MNVKTKASGVIISMFTLFTLLTVMVVQPIYADAGDVKNAESSAIVTFTPGRIELAEVPEFKFDTQEIAGTLESYPSITGSGTTIKISDLRGASEGWKLDVSLSAFKRAGDGEDDGIKNAYIEIENASVSSINGAASAPPVITQNEQNKIRLISNGEMTRVLDATNNAGRGIWLLRWDMPNAKLSILPGAAQAGAYTAILDWTLQLAE